jgi:hypothetical protein
MPFDEETSDTIKCTKWVHQWPCPEMITLLLRFMAQTFEWKMSESPKLA